MKELIINEVLNKYNISIQFIATRNRARRRVVVRGVLAWFLYNYVDISLKEIGEIIGNGTPYNGSSVVNWIQKTDNAVRSSHRKDVSTQITINEIAKKLGLGEPLKVKVPNSVQKRITLRDTRAKQYQQIIGKIKKGYTRRRVIESLSLTQGVYDGIMKRFKTSYTKIRLEYLKEQLGWNKQ